MVYDYDIRNFIFSELQCVSGNVSFVVKEEITGGVQLYVGNSSVTRELVTPRNGQHQASYDCEMILELVCVGKSYKLCSDLMNRAIERLQTTDYYDLPLSRRISDIRVGESHMNESESSTERLVMFSINIHIFYGE
ncbi:hypothetical protein NMD96_12895 [Edwardsiella tarda]|uniref:hypothetical protein n=1 Tax=Edwardsiella tarda TaxID=636 RepID=UPI00351C1C38